MTNFIRISFFGFLLIQSTLAFAQPSNDDPCNAIPITAGSSCVFTSSTNAAATNTAGVPAPGCAAYSGQDVWYSVVVPAGGILNLDSNTGTITDGAMAAYSGTCSSLSLISCNDDGSVNGLMPQLYLTGLTPGSTIFIRFWEYGGGTGTFSLCASAPAPAPPCGSSPPAGNSCALATPICDLNGYCGNTSGSYTANSWTQLTTVFCGSIENNSFLSFTASSSSISFDVWVNSSSMGYGIQILIFSAVNCSGTVTQYGPCYNPGVVQPGPVNITANGLTPGNTYYIMIDGNSGDVCNYTIGANSGISTPVVVDPATITICQGESVNISASGGDGTYTWDDSPDLNTTSGANVTATPTISGTFNYTVNSSTGNPLCPSSTSATTVVTVDDCGCNVVAGNSGPICSGETANLTATNNPNVTYSWSGPGGFTSLDQNPINVTVPSTPGTYDYTVTATPDMGDPCISVTTITVNANPTANAGSYSAVCDNDADVVLAGTPAGGVFSGTGVTGTNFDPSVGTQTITYDYVDGNGCEATSNTVITVNTTPVVNAGTYSAVCENDDIIVLAGTPAGGTFSGTGVTGSTFDPTAGTQTISYEYTELGCTANTTTTITVNSLPTVDAGTYSSVCEDATAIALAGTPAGGTFSGTGVTGNNFDPSAGSQIVTYNYTDGNDCSAAATTTIVIHSLPTIVAGNDQSICEGTEVILSGSGGISYDWDNGGENGVPFTPSSGTYNYTVTGTDANGCTNTDQLTLTVLPNPEANVSSDFNSGTAPLEITFFNNSLFGTSYNWNFGDGANLNTFNLTNTQHTYSAGEYEVILIASNGICQDADTVYIIVIPPLAPEIHIPNVFTPNGDNANDVFFIGATNATTVNVKIFNRWGELMHEIKNPLEFWDGRTANGNEANDGVYFIKYEVVGVNGEVLSGHGNVSLVR